jgi:hypothetical protein
MLSRGGGPLLPLANGTQTLSFWTARGPGMSEWEGPGLLDPGESPVPGRHVTGGVVDFVYLIVCLANTVSFVQGHLVPTCPVGLSGWLGTGPAAPAPPRMPYLGTWSLR